MSFVKRRLLFCHLALCIWFSSPTPLQAEEKVFVNGIDSNFPPFAYLDKDRNPDGFDVKAVEWIAREMGFSIRHEPTEWDSVVVCLKDKGIDLIASGMNITEKAKGEVNFTIPYWTVQRVIIAAKDSNLGVEQILSGGRRVAVLRGTDEAEWIEENLSGKAGKRFTTVLYDSAQSAVEDLLTGRVSGAAMSEPQAKDAANGKPVKVLGPFGMPNEQFGYAVRKEDTAFLEVLNAGLKKLMASPYWEELRKRYMD